MINIKAIIFDLGNVLIDYSFHRAFHKWAELTLHPQDFFASQFQYDETLWQFERGQITPREYYQYLSQSMQITWDYDMFKQGWIFVNIGLIQEMVALLPILSEKFSLYVLSNTNELHIESVKHEFPQIFRYFKQEFYSHELSARKPDAEIYDKVIQMINLPPHEILFIDDMEENIRGAERAGIHGIVMSSATELKQELVKLGILD
ncbi:MAG: HAD family phosphatase [Promethearchaeota archaeon]|nr:MAG: HAD family phosphatase [Candidatus Lokiarchaeota archaeon]